MKAIVQTAYGGPEVFELRELDPPAFKDDEVLVRVQAAGLHAGDVFCMRGVPYGVRAVVGLPRPKGYVPGYDVAGRVEAVGPHVKRFQPGDAVFGACKGACAEYARAKEAHLVTQPAELTFDQTAAVPTSALAALHGLRDAGGLQSGQAVLINGASGGVGTFAVQIAKALGAEVTGVCSARNVDLVKALGADRVIDYAQADFTKSGRRYDLILDNVANRAFADCRRALKPEGKLVPNSGHAGMGYVLKAFARAPFVRQQGRPYVSSPNQADLSALKELLEAGRITPVVDRTYPLSGVPEALGYLGQGHARGKVVVVLDPAGAS